MNHQDSVFFWSFPVGTWFGTQIRVSWFFPFLLLYFIWKYGIPLGCAIEGVLFVSILLHEFGHIFGARLTGGSGNEVLMWPLGGLAFVRPAGTLRSQILTTGGGPLVNLGLCLMTLVPTMQGGYLKSSLMFTMPPLALETAIWYDLLVLTFFLNWILLLLNLIPVMPLDGGRMLRTIATTRIGARRAVEISVLVGFAVGAIAMFVGLLIEKPDVVFIGAIVFIANLMERHQLQQSEQFDESFMGYDFSQGYTSLEQSDTQPERQPGFWQRRKDRRRAEKAQRQAEKDQEAERVLDELLEKVHQQGMDSLTEAEKRQLARASDRYRNKDNPKP